MTLWDQMKRELDRVAQTAEAALDEGKDRLEILRLRQLADRAAQHLGYAVHRARAAGTPLSEEELARYSATLAGHEAEIARLEARIREAGVCATANGTAGPASSTDPGPMPGASDAGATI